MSILKTTISLQVLAATEVLGARMLATNKVGDVKSGNRLKHVKSKLGKLESQKLAKSQKSSKLKSEKSKKPGNSPNFNATKARPNFLTPGIREAFNRLRLAFTKALILQYFNPKYHIQIKINALGYAIGGALS